MRLLLLWLLHAGIIFLVSLLLPGIQLHSFWSALMTALVLGLVNAIVRPVLVFLTLPAVVLSMGLFLLVINAFGLWLVAALVPGFEIATFWDALVASVVIALLATFARWLLHL